MMLIMILAWMGLHGVWSQGLSTVVSYDEEDGLPHGHVTQLLQDEQGLMWFATWNGLCRYDGYEFRTFKSQAGDGCRMVTDRFRDIALRPDGQILCRVDDDYYLFDTRSYRFVDLADSEARQAADDMKRYRMSQAWTGDDGRRGFAYTDRQGNRWILAGTGISKVATAEQRIERLDIQPRGEVKCLFTDRQERCWVATKNDGAVRIYSATDARLMGYLGDDGRLHAGYTRFGAAVYCMYQSADGTLWLGTKPDGLYRLRDHGDGTFQIDRLRDLPNGNVYSVTGDSFGRLWVATLGGGLCYTDEPQAPQPRFLMPSGYPQDGFQRVRFLYHDEHGGVLMATTTDGLVVAKLEQNVNNMRFHRHQREPQRVESLSSSATIDIFQDWHGRYYVSTESGGINRLEGNDLTADRLSFSHYSAANHLLPSDVVLSATRLDRGGAMVVSSHLVSLVDSVGHYRMLDARYFNGDVRFSDARPQQIGGDRWLFGLQDGAFMTSVSQMYRQTYRPRLVLTGVSIQGGRDNWAVTTIDTLTLSPGERSLTVRFAAIDYCAPERITYAFRVLPSQEWIFIGHDRSATLLDLEPGCCHLEIRSTNADGEWQDNVRRLTIVVRPTFWESVWGRLLILLLVVAAIAAITCTLLYIRRIKRQQRQTLEAYLSLLEDSQPQVPKAGSRQPDMKDPVLERTMAFIEEHMADSDIGVGDMAQAAATSRSGLQRKLKQAMGITPQDLLREARIKRACQLLHTSSKTIAEVAYACGFSDPKYFSRSFKQRMGLSPSEYREAGK